MESDPRLYVCMYVYMYVCMYICMYDACKVSELVIYVKLACTVLEIRIRN